MVYPPATVNGVGRASEPDSPATAMESQPNTGPDRPRKGCPRALGGVLGCAVGRRLALRAALLITLLGFSALGFAAPQVASPELWTLVRDLESPEFALREKAANSLAAAGDAGARAALDGFTSATPSARLARAHVVRQAGEGSLLDEVLPLCADPSPSVRAEFAGYLGRVLREHPGPSATQLERACERLYDMAVGGTQPAVRAAALEALSRADLDPAARALAGLTADLSGGGAVLAARALANSPRAGGLLLELVQSNFDGQGPRLEERTLSVLLADGYGASLAEAERGGLEPRARLPFSIGGRSPSPDVRAASALGFQGFLARARFLGATERAEQVSALLAPEVVDPERVWLASALLTLTAGKDPARALSALEQLKALLGSPRADDARGRFDLAVADTLAAAAQLACGKNELASAQLELARTLLGGLAAEGLERSGNAGAALASEVAAERAVVESYALLALLREGRAFDAPECLAIGRTLHGLTLRAQLLATLGTLETWTGDLDTLVHHPHSPFDLLLSNPELERGLGAHPLDLSLALARALAAAVPDELPGFAVPGEVQELDGMRLALLTQIEYSRIEQLQRELSRLPAEATERVELENALRVLKAQLSPQPDLHRVRLPSALAIELAGDLRDEGRPEAAAELARNVKEALSRADFLFGGPYIQELIARAESTLGACATDQGQPEQADKILNGALSRLETVSSSGPDDLRSKAVRSNVLVSLSVNANVKLRDPAKALAYFERAFELRQDDFTRLLLACYRARAGRKDEARALLREMPESPFNFYNLACTYALLGDKELALDYLARELRPGSKSAGAIERQRIWARTDPDLASLQGEARFQALVGK